MEHPDKSEPPQLGLHGGNLLAVYPNRVHELDQILGEPLNIGDLVNSP